MDLQKLVAQAATIETIVEKPGWRLDETIDELVESGDWDLAGRLLVSASEIPARQLAKKLVDKRAFEPLVVAACLRRQPRRPGEGASGGGGAVASRVFRDIDADNDAAGIPDYIRTDIEEMAKSAAATRATAMSKDAAVDRDPIRQYIIEQLAPLMATTEEAMNAVVVIARASAWEETRRTAALKVANDELCVTRLCRALRTDDILDIARMALLEAVSVTFAKEMGKFFKGFSDNRDVKALEFIAKHHPAEQYRDTAKQWVEALQKQGASGES
ncbi:MAG: hypothetical protein QM473_04910 [Acidobacteriota bacterium]|nr:hypothetical protein [Acidobacteriota bacterium]